MQKFKKLFTGTKSAKDSENTPSSREIDTFHKTQPPHKLTNQSRTLHHGSAFLRFKNQFFPQ